MDSTASTPSQLTSAAKRAKTSTEEPPPLLDAVRNRRHPDVRALLDDGEDPNASCGQTPLLIATLNNDPPMVTMLLEAGANPHQADDDGKTPLPAAIRGRHTKVALMLIAAGADPNARHADGTPPIHSACEEGLCEVVDALIKAGARCSLRHEGITPIFRAVKHGHLGLLNVLVAANAKLDEAVGCVRFLWHTQTPLTLAATLGNLDMVRALVERGASTDIPHLREMVPLHAAARRGHGHVVKYLVDAGADFEIRDSIGRSTLHLAAAFCDPDVVRYLLRAGADPDARADNLNTPLLKAIHYDRPDVFDILVRAGATYDLRGDAGRPYYETPVWAGANYGHEYMRAALRLGASPLGPDPRGGRTPYDEGPARALLDHVAALPCLPSSAVPSLAQMAACAVGSLC